jgi:Phosphotransferase system, mannose/fructose/N-acetylgalactosamine-specific component IIC
LLLIAIVAGLWATIQAWRPGYGTHEVLFQPLITAFIFGIAFGDMHTAMILGSAIGMMYIGLIAPGSELPQDMGLAGSIGIPIAMQSGMDAQTAMVLAVPFGVLGVFINQLRRIINANSAHRADKFALTCNEKGIQHAALWYPLAVNFVLRFPPVFIAVYFGSTVVQSFIAMLPAWVLHGISVAGGVLPAMGLALIITLIGRPSVMPFFFMGFFLIEFSGLSTLAAACFGIPLAIVVVLMSKENQDNVMKEVKVLVAGSRDDDDDDDDE